MIMLPLLRYYNNVTGIYLGKCFFEALCMIRPCLHGVGKLVTSLLLMWYITCIQVVYIVAM